MFGLVRNWQNGLGSPKSGDLPDAASSPSSAPAHAESSKSPTTSPKVDVGEIDTRAPFASVKAAVSLFGDVVSPRARPVTKKAKAEEQRVLEKETQHHMILRELDYHKDQLKNTEAAKAQASKELHQAKRTLQEITNKLETLSESKQAAIKATEDAKNRAKELEEHKTAKAQPGNEAWKLDVDTERECYKASAAELIASKQELKNLRQDFDAALEAKLAAFQEAEEAAHAAKLNQEKHSQLFKEVAMMRETLDQVKLASLEAEDEHLKLTAEKEVRLLVHKSAKEAAEKEMDRLREECGPEEKLKQKLEETTEAINVLQEQLNDVRASDIISLQEKVSELNIAKKSLQEVLAEEASIRSSVDALKLQLEEVKRDRLASDKTALEAAAKVEQMQADLQKLKTELQDATSRNVFKEMQLALEKSLAEAESSRHEAEQIQKDIDLLKQDAEAAKMATKEAEEKLEVALKEAEVAKAAEKLADDQIHNSPRTDADDIKSGSGSSRRIRLSVEEFESMKKKIEELKNEGDIKVATAMAQVENISASEKEVLQKVEAMMKENEDIQSEIEDALKRTEMAEAAKKVVENELQKWREKQTEVGEPSCTAGLKC